MIKRYINIDYYYSYYLCIVSLQCLSQMDNLIDSSEFFVFYWYPHTEGAVMRQRDRTDKPVESSFNWFKDSLIGYYLLELLYWIW